MDESAKGSTFANKTLHLSLWMKDLCIGEIYPRAFAQSSPLHSHLCIRLLFSDPRCLQGEHLISSCVCEI